MVEIIDQPLVLPRFFKPRSYQAEFISAMRRGQKRAALVWHRRAGKDSTTLNWTIEAMWKRVGTYFYFLPTYAQGKRIIWDGIQADGFAFLRHFPDELVVARNETEMKITMENGSVFQVVGADNIDSIVGTNPVGCVFSEFSVMNPRAWELMRPILAENGGWAVFDFTPRGRNWAWKLWDAAGLQASWFTSLRTVDHTSRDSVLESGGPVITPEAIQAERDAGMDEDLIQQEFYCSFTGSMRGNFYGDLLETMREEGRIGARPYDRDEFVDTSWDLGVDDETVIGFWQDAVDLRTGRRYLNLIDVHADNKNGLEHYWKLLKEKPYTYGRHFGPHDLAVKEWGTGNTRLQTAWRIGLNFEVVPKIGLADGIQATRRMLPLVAVDEERCYRWIDAMTGYRKEFNERTMTYSSTPVHDWTSHWADMTRYRAIAYDNQAIARLAKRGQRPDQADIDYDVFESPEARAARAGGPVFDDWNRSRGSMR